MLDGLAQPVAPVNEEPPTASVDRDGVGASAWQPRFAVADGMVGSALPGVGLLNVALTEVVLLAGVFAGEVGGAVVEGCFGGTVPPEPPAEPPPRPMKWMA